MTHTDTQTLIRTEEVHTWEEASDKHDEQEGAGEPSHVLCGTLLGWKGLVCARRPHAVNEEVRCSFDR